jgi:hypothetical protein
MMIDAVVIDEGVVLAATRNADKWTIGIIVEIVVARALIRVVHVQNVG